MRPPACVLFLVVVGAAACGTGRRGLAVEPWRVVRDDAAAEGTLFVRGDELLVHVARKPLPRTPRPAGILLVHLEALDGDAIFLAEAVGVDWEDRRWVGDLSQLGHRIPLVLAGRFAGQGLEHLAFAAAGRIHRVGRGDEPEVVADLGVAPVDGAVFRLAGRDAALVAFGGSLGVLRFSDGRYQVRTILRQEPAFTSVVGDGNPALFAADRAGRVLRLERTGGTGNGAWRVQEILRGPPGEVRLAAGPFGVAVGGPTRGLVVLRRGPDGSFRAEEVAPRLHTECVRAFGARIACLGFGRLVVLARG